MSEIKIFFDDEKYLFAKIADFGNTNNIPYNDLYNWYANCIKEMVKGKDITVEFIVGYDYECSATCKGYRLTGDSNDLMHFKLLYM